MRCRSATSRRGRSCCGRRHHAHGVQADFLADRDPERLPARRSREPLRRRPRPPGARPGHRAGRGNHLAVSLGDGRSPPTERSMSAAATRARSSRSTAPGKPRHSSTRPSSKSTPWRWRRTAPCMPPLRLTGASTRSIAAAGALRSSIRRTNTSGASRLTQAGNVFAGTGEKGTIYRITPDGKSSTFYQTKATHVITLAFERSGQLLAGTEGPGRVFRVDAGGKGFLLLDSTFQEIRALRIDEADNIYLAALSGRTTGSSQPPAAHPARCQGPTSGGREPVPTVTTEVTAIAVLDTGGASVGRHRGARARGASRRPRRHLPDSARRVVGHSLGIVRRLAVRRHARRAGRARGRHRAETARSSASAGIRRPPRS